MDKDYSMNDIDAILAEFTGLDFRVGDQDAPTQMPLPWAEEPKPARPTAKAAATPLAAPATPISKPVEPKSPEPPRRAWEAPAPAPKATERPRAETPPRRYEPQDFPTRRAAQGFAPAERPVIPSPTPRKPRTNELSEGGLNEKTKSPARPSLPFMHRDEQREPRPAVSFGKSKAAAEETPKAGPRPGMSNTKPETNRPQRKEYPQTERPIPAPKSRGNFLTALIFTAASVLVLVWTLFNLHPASATLSTASGSGVLRLSDKLDNYANNSVSDALGELSYIKKIYTIQETDTVSPKPNPACYGSTSDPADIADVIARAAPLLEGQSIIFDPKADFVPGEEIRYYLDDTILAIAWKEYINERCCTCAEVKVAHGSQIRRKIAEDSYSSSVQLYASDMAKQANSVLAINGDFYAFRDLGITVYQRNLMRNNPAKVDSCFFTADGDMLFSRAGELMGEGEAQQFIDDNDVVFGIAFGPVLVDNWELQYCQSYPIGEINSEYSRACIGMTDKLHYFMMTINHTPDGRPRATVNELARFIYSKGVQKAYNLDGGQTSELIMHGAPINHVDYGFERAVSDIIYFATAIPNQEEGR